MRLSDRKGRVLAGRMRRMKKRLFTALIGREGKTYVALCPELDVASQGDSVKEARANLQEAVELFLESADRKEIKKRLHDEVLVTRLEVAVG
jgi:predicted RNase H-like HicB family nuclease